MTRRSRESQDLAEVERGDLAELGERPADQEFRRLVVENKHALLVDQEHRRSEVRAKLAGEDQRKALRLPACVRHFLTLLIVGGVAPGSATGSTRGGP